MRFAGTTYSFGSVLQPWPARCIACGLRPVLVGLLVGLYDRPMYLGAVHPGCAEVALARLLRGVSADTWRVLSAVEADEGEG